MPQLTGLTLAYPDVPAPVRARFMTPDRAGAGPDVFVLTTCLRVELAWLGSLEAAPGVLAGLYGGTELPGSTIRSDADAFRHLARVAAGLESAQVGEREVLTQFRQAVRALEGDASAGSGLARVLESAVGVARAVRRSMPYRPDGSLAVAAARMTSQDGPVAVLGGGAMARAVVAEVSGGEVTVFARRPVGGTSWRPWSDVAGALSEYPTVVSTVPGPLSLPRVRVSDVLADRESPLVFIDLGMPSAVEAHWLPDSVDYRDVDAVADSLAYSVQAIADEVAAFEAAVIWDRLSVSDRAGSLIAAILTHGEAAVDDEVRRFADRLSGADDPERLLRQLARTVARRIIHPTISYVGSSPRPADELDVLARAFGIDDV